tara:strand:+ start:2233 stop:2442 length:210 start_codon:yes stop_codon:yes gene_type:complete
MIKLSDKPRIAIKNMIVKESASNRFKLWWMLWGMMGMADHSDWMIISRYQDRYTRSRFIEEKNHAGEEV